MPGLPQRNDNAEFTDFTMSCSDGSVNGFWSKHRGDVSYNQLQKVYYFLMYVFVLFCDCFCCVVDFVVCDVK